ncbi:TadE/TadG family type IV pilus assembly protein [Rhodospira trueperi]|uniref:TadE/TadG family type IV pilus assembly protein n=1 Tax=Rhodospira trueperi TaxID=69960 RepID=UPI00159F9E44|nr:TadE/TadG family type IV pilus assembly protein [Rhodospira trueperi]
MFRCKRGTAAIEAALILPILLTMMLGMVELTTYVEATRKAVSAAQTVADLVAQESATTDNDLDVIRLAAESILAPLDTKNGKLKIAIASIGFDDDDGSTFVLWDDKDAGAPPVVPSDADGLGSPGESVVMVSMSFQYDSPFGFMLTSSTLEESAFSRPRITRRIALNGKTDHNS